MTHDDQQAKALRLGLDLSLFTGDLERFRHPIKRQVIYTPGVQHLAQEAEAYWLIDAIASWIGSHPFVQAIKQDERLETVHFWRLEVDSENSSGVLTAVSDKGKAPFITQRIPFTNFPLPAIDIWCGFDGRHWTLYLPSEH